MPRKNDRIFIHQTYSQFQMKQPHKHTALLFIALGIVAVLLLLIDMATGDTYIPVLKVWAVLIGGEYDETTRNILLSIRFIRVVVAGLIGVALSVRAACRCDSFSESAGRPLSAGSQFGRRTRSGSVYTRRSVARMDELPASPIIGYRRFGMDRNGCHPIGSSRHQPESEKYSRCC